MFTITQFPKARNLTSIPIIPLVVCSPLLIQQSVASQINELKISYKDSSASVTSVHIKSGSSKETQINRILKDSEKISLKPGWYIFTIVYMGKTYSNKRFVFEEAQTCSPKKIENSNPFYVCL